MMQILFDIGAFVASATVFWRRANVATVELIWGLLR